METSTNFGFYLPSRDTDDIADINQISDNFRKIDDEVQEKLESGKNLKTINNQSLLGSGNVEIQGGSGEADQKYSPKSPNAQSGKAVAEAVAPKMDKFGEVTLTPHPMPEYGSDYIAADVKLNADKFNLLNNQGDKVFQLNYGMVGELEVYRNINFKENYTISNLPTPSGANVLQAANVEFVKKARDMQLLFDHTITESETSVWSYRVTLPFPIDKYYIYIEYPANFDTSHQFALHGIDANNTITYVAYLATNIGAKLSVFRGEKLGTTITQWDAEYSYFKPFLYDCTWRPAYRALNLGNIVAFDVIDEQHFVEGTKIQIWGRDAI